MKHRKPYDHATDLIKKVLTVGPGGMSDKDIEDAKRIVQPFRAGDTVSVTGFKETVRVTQIDKHNNVCFFHDGKFHAVTPDKCRLWFRENGGSKT